MDVHLLMTERNYGRGNDKEKIVMDSSGLISCTFASAVREITTATSAFNANTASNATTSSKAIATSLHFRSSDTSKSLSIPLAWILKIEPMDENQLIISHFLRDEKEFYLFNNCKSVLTFENGFDCQMLLTRLRERHDAVEWTGPKNILVILNTKAGWGKSVDQFNEGSVKTMKNK